MATNVESSKATDAKVVSIKDNKGGMLSWSFPEALMLKTLTKAFYDFSGFNFSSCCLFGFFLI